MVFATRKLHTVPANTCKCVGKIQKIPIHNWVRAPVHYMLHTLLQTALELAILKKLGQQQHVCKVPQPMCEHQGLPKCLGKGSQAIGHPTWHFVQEL